MTWLTLFALIAVVLLLWNLYSRLGSDRLAQFNDRRRATSQLVSRGEYIDGNRHLAVALAVTPSTFFYENSDMEASIDLEWIREIEYDNELATGTAIEVGKVLRLRSVSQTFEFVLPHDVTERWQAALPSRTAATAH